MIELIPIMVDIDQASGEPPSLRTVFSATFRVAGQKDQCKRLTQAQLDAIVNALSSLRIPDPEENDQECHSDEPTPQPR